MKNISINFAETVGKIKPMHAGCNGPHYPLHCAVDASELYVKAGVPYVRLHDTLSIPPAEVDITAIFPDMSKDPADPASYDFRKTDEYLYHIVKNNIPIRYRLGQTIEHHSVKVGILPPEDPQKWADVCVGILKHYNEGWANGFHYDIKHWEIWEEADNIGQLWGGTEDEFFVLYEKAAKALKAYAPNVYVGGYAAMDVHLPFLPNFLKYVKETNAPLDFFSFDTYTDNPKQYAANTAFAREKLNEFGFTDTFMYIAEWNNCGFAPAGEPFWSLDPVIATRKSEMRHSQKAMAFNAASMIVMQNTELESACFYVFTPNKPTWSVMNGCGLAYKNYYAFPAFNELYKLGAQVKAESEDDVYCLAAKDEAGNGAVLISNFGDEEITYRIGMKLCDCSEYRAEYLVGDDKKDLEYAGAAEFKGSCNMEYILPKDSILLIKLKKQ